MHGPLHASLHACYPGARGQGIRAVRYRRCPARLGLARQRYRHHPARLPALPEEVVMTSDAAQITVRDLRLAYGRKEVLHGISFDIQRNEIPKPTRHIPA